ncbi:lipopolysaccharide biosynthesis protein [Chryseobacterium lacus]|uniref:lipopolysaccharide biosynthesis protein n=1 Tax=Chryseobacterium lacus TaxID=2058346 RepID=UPI000F865230|nr:oligosaccharide flippase family protein [Chryseobacterium lacus]RST26203.1 polysaccharide biosynthesis protein [Chryseobacterium lacus]
MYKKLFGQTAMYGLTTIIIRLFPFILSPYIFEAFGPTAYAPYADFYSVAGIIIVLLTHGMETTFFRFALDEKDSKKLISTAFFSVLFAALSFLILGLAFREPLAVAFKTPDQVHLLSLLVMILALDAFSAMPFVILRKQERPLKFAVIKTINGVINFCLVIFFIKILPSFPQGILGLKYSPEFGIGYVFVANLIASAVTFLLLSGEVFAARILHFDPTLWKKMLKYSLPIMFAGLAGIVNETLDRQFLKFLLPDGIAQEQLGIYGGVTKIVTFVLLFKQAYVLGVEPFFFSHSKNENSRATYARLMDVFITVNCLIILFLTVNLSWLAPMYLRNPAYFIGIDILPVLFIATLFLGIYLNLSVWYKLTDRTVYGAYISVAGAAVTIVINVVFIPQFGYWASTWATLAAYFVMMMISLIWGQARFPIPYHFYRNTVIILITIVIALAYYQNLKQYILLGNIIFLVLAAVFIINQKLIPARMLNKIKK